MLRFAVTFAFAAVATMVLGQFQTWLKAWRTANPIWRGVHVLVTNDAMLESLERQAPALAKLGVNVLIVEVDYSFQFSRRPEMRDPNGISKAAARRLADACRQVGIRPIPEINCLGHQSWEKTTLALLTKHPEFDETPGQYPDNKGIYCRSWCPQHPEVNKVVFDLVDELADAFQADAFHVGMDEVFIIGSEFCPRCKGQSTAKLFAKAVNDFHSHFKRRKLEMLMWGDRLLDAKSTGNSVWEASGNDTWRAIDAVPKDIVLCDWHYSKQSQYKSISALTSKGFKVWPSGWNDVSAVEALAGAGLASKRQGVIGYLATTWGAISPDQLSTWPPILAGLRIWTSPPSKPTAR